MAGIVPARRIWSFQAVDDCTQMANAIHDRYGEMDVMLRCLDAAIANLESVVKALEPKYGELKKWVPDAQAEYSTLTTGWEQYLSLARSIPISSTMLRFMTGRDVSHGRGRPQRQATLEDLVDLDTARKAGRLAPAALRKFTGRIADLDKVAARLFQDAERLFREFEKTVARTSLSQDGESMQLLQDIEAIATKVDTDYQTVSEYASSTREVSQASKLAANHTEHLLPSLRKRAMEMDEMLRQATQARNGLAAETVDYMRSITDITALSHAVKSQVQSVNQEDELATFDYLRLIQQVPYMYASFVAEAVKRREWFDKVKQDSSTLANEMALFQEEEVKRRRKWQKSVGDAYGPENFTADSNVPGLEVNLLGEEAQWPTMARTDMEEFLELLQRQKPDPELVADIVKLIADSNGPTKQQNRRLKAFKNGSVHEAALGRSGLLIRGDDDLLRNLQEDKSKLESKLKTAESRVRRLEDLLHRQSQASRPNLGNIFQTPSQQLPDRNDSTISVRTSKTTEDRGPTSDGTEVLVHRIQQLEGELGLERERLAVFERDLNAKDTLHDDMKGKMEEANSTKKDLLENMEALKREFVEERKSLEDEIKRLQSRLEDAEDEIEHFGDSRENEKVLNDGKLHALELEVERLTKEKHDDALKSDGQVEFLRKEARLQRERLETQEKQLLASQDNTRVLSEELNILEEESELRLTALRQLHEQLLPDTTIPEHLPDFVGAITGVLTGMTSQMRSTEGDLRLLKSDLDLAQKTTKELREQLAAAASKLSGAEVESMHIGEKYSEEKAKVTALEAELVGGREQLDQLRAQIADGETGSQSLRKRLVEAEARIASVTEEVASRQSQVGSLEEELRLFRERFEESQVKLSQLNLRLDSRTERARDLTQRLFSQSDRLGRLLERLGFSVTRQGDSMVIQKVPRAERSPQNATDMDLSSSLRRSDTLSNRMGSESADLEPLYWMNSPDPEAEASKYDAFISTLGSFDIDAVSETVYKRVKDVEHMARKLQRDARSYREKAHALHKESHDKIAFKQFKEGDLALFLLTRNQTTGAWAAFNVGFPHYFLREQEFHRLRSRGVACGPHLSDSGKSCGSIQVPAAADRREPERRQSYRGYGDGLPRGGGKRQSLRPLGRLALVPHRRQRRQARRTVNSRAGQSTVAANNVEAVADIGHGRSVLKGGGRNGAPSAIEGVSKTLSKSLESRRSSTGSRKALPFAIGSARGRDSALASETNSLRAAPADTPEATSPTHVLQQQQQQRHEAAQAGTSQAELHANPQQMAKPADQTSPEDRKGPARSTPTSPEVRSEIDSLLGP